MTGTILSLDTWRALGCEYLDDTWHAQRPAFVEHGCAQSWGELLDHVSAGVTSDIKPLGVRGGRITTTLRGVPLHWEPREDADDVITSYDELFRWHHTPALGALPLSDLYHDHPYFGRVDNLQFRAWHDTAHLTNDLGFTHDEELVLFGRQARELSPFARNALFCESVYQLAASVVLGGYPEHQYCRRIGPVGRAVRDLLVGLA